MYVRMHACLRVVYVYAACSQPRSHMLHLCRAVTNCSILDTGQTVMGDDYRLYFLEDQQNQPVAVVLPKDATQELTPRLPEVSTCK